MKVLIAEDDPVSRRVAEALFAKWGYEVVVVQDGAEAWRALEREDAPRLAVLDWMMPGLAGTDICKGVRAREGRPYVYILLLTAKAQKSDLLEGMDAGADDYLVKPFDAHELRARLHVGQRIIELQDELIAAREVLRFRATHDFLTGLPNRGEILEVLRRELVRGLRGGTPVGIILGDLDHFKQVNDSFGHLAGDEVLRTIAQRMANVVRAYDTVGRFGGEEFLVVVPASDTTGTLSQAERIRSCIESQPVETQAGPIPVTMSMGVVASSSELMGQSDATSEPDALLAAADAALYRAKELGRNRAELATPIDLAATVTHPNNGE
jgi:two-component system, cell cycle response regulator